MSHTIPFEQAAEQSTAPEMSKSELTAKRAALQRLREAVVGLEQGGPTPREQRAIGYAAVVAAAGALLLSRYFDGWFGPTLVMSGGAYLASKLRSKAPRTWAEVLDARLAEYSPFSREAFIALQGQLKAVGFLDGAIVRSWLETEAERCADAVKQVYGAPANRFLQKQL